MKKGFLVYFSYLIESSFKAAKLKKSRMGMMLCSEIPDSIIFSYGAAYGLAQLEMTLEAD